VKLGVCAFFFLLGTLYVAIVPAIVNTFGDKIMLFGEEAIASESN